MPTPPIEGPVIMDAQTFINLGANGRGREIQSSVTLIFSCDASGNELNWTAPHDGAVITVNATSNTFCLSVNNPASIKAIGTQALYTDMILSSNSVTPGAGVSGINFYYLFKKSDIIRCKMTFGSANMIHVFCVLFADVVTA